MRKNKKLESLKANSNLFSIENIYGGAVPPANDSRGGGHVRIRTGAGTSRSEGTYDQEAEVCKWDIIKDPNEL